jgi:cytoskeletal protein RodZ
MLTIGYRPETRLMESNIKNQQSSGADLNLSEPHFDEEATLLSARPVVPLRDVRPKTRSERRLVLGLAMAISVMAGVLGATLIYKQRGQKQATGTVETATEASEPKAQPLSGAAGAISKSPASTPSVSEDLNAATRREVQSASDITEPSKAAPLFSPGAESGRANGTQQSEADNRQDERAKRRAERMEARRLRRDAEREAKKETRAHKGQSSSDLLRIREIFEGPPRP